MEVQETTFRQKRLGKIAPRAMASEHLPPIAAGCPCSWYDLSNQVYEQGTRAAAVTVAVPVPVSAPPPFEGIYFTLDRPFVFVIRDLTTDTVLFIGRIASPDPYQGPERTG